MAEERFIALEVKISHQEALLEELHQVLYQQQETIDSMEIKLNSLLKRIEDAPGIGGEIGPHNQKPPHY
jgi:SlyX protein